MITIAVDMTSITLWEVAVISNPKIGMGYLSIIKNKRSSIASFAKNPAKNIAAKILDCLVITYNFKIS
ncbi:hypothetical protein D3C85_1792880 [compost metagenome]